MAFTKRTDRPLLAYKVTNTVNGKCYIGITSQGVDRRWTEHRSDARRGRRSFLCMAIRKYGPENFTIEAVAQARDWADLPESLSLRSLAKGGPGAVRYAGVSYPCVAVAAQAAGVSKSTWVRFFGPDVPAMLPGRRPLAERVAA